MATEELTTKERMRRLHNKEPIDRIPVAGHLGLYGSIISATPFKEYWTDPQKSYRATSLAIDLHGFDETPSYTYGWSDWIVTELGGEVRFSDNAYGLPSITRRTVDKPSDVESLEFPRYGTGPVSSHMLECARLNVINGGKASVNISVTRIVSVVLGSEKLCRWYFKEPNAVHLFYRKATDYILSIMELYIKEFGADKVSIAEGLPLDSQNLISADIFEKFTYIYTKEIHEKGIAAGVKSWSLHLCGNHTNNLPFWKRIPIPPRTNVSMGSEMDIEKTADFFGPDHIIQGNVSTQLLQFGTPEEIEMECKRIIEKVKNHPGGFILSPACAMPPAAPPVNVHAMVKAAKSYGRYN
jgi:uroporphyrinogen decarboxylase